MITKTKGIALGKIKYGETSIIVRIFTEQFGMQAYLVNGIRSKKGKFKIALFQPLTLLDLVVYHKESSGIQRMSEVKCSYPYSSIEGNMKRSAIFIFLTEILEKTLRECSNPEEIYEFLQDSLIHFDNQRDGDNTFHLKFLIEFSGLLGFRPQSLRDFENHISGDKDYFNNEVRNFLKAIIENRDQKIPHSTNSTRRNCLNLIINYYKSHIDNLKEVKSMSILREVLD